MLPALDAAVRSAPDRKNSLSMRSDEAASTVSSLPALGGSGAAAADRVLSPLGGARPLSSSLREAREAAATAGGGSRQASASASRPPTPSSLPRVLSPLSHRPLSSSGTADQRSTRPPLLPPAPRPASRQRSEDTRKATAAPVGKVSAAEATMPAPLAPAAARHPKAQRPPDGSVSEAAVRPVEGLRSAAEVVGTAGIGTNPTEVPAAAKPSVEKPQPAQQEVAGTAQQPAGEMPQSAGYQAAATQKPADQTPTPAARPTDPSEALKPTAETPKTVSEVPKSTATATSKPAEAPAAPKLAVEKSPAAAEATVAPHPVSVKAAPTPAAAESGTAAPKTTEKPVAMKSSAVTPEVVSEAPQTTAKPGAMPRLAGQVSVTAASKAALAVTATPYTPPGAGKPAEVSKLVAEAPPTAEVPMSGPDLNFSVSATGAASKPDAAETPAQKSTGVSAVEKPADERPTPVARPTHTPEVPKPNAETPKTVSEVPQSTSKVSAAAASKPAETRAAPKPAVETPPTVATAAAEATVATQPVTVKAAESPKPAAAESGTAAPKTAEKVAEAKPAVEVSPVPKRVETPKPVDEVAVAAVSKPALEAAGAPIPIPGTPDAVSKPDETTKIGADLPVSVAALVPIDTTPDPNTPPAMAATTSTEALTAPRPVRSSEVSKPKPGAEASVTKSADTSKPSAQVPVAAVSKPAPEAPPAALEGGKSAVEAPPTSGESLDTPKPSAAAPKPAEGVAAAPTPLTEGLQPAGELTVGKLPDPKPDVEATPTPFRAVDAAPKVAAEVLPTAPEEPALVTPKPTDAAPGPMTTAAEPPTDENALIVSILHEFVACVLLRGEAAATAVLTSPPPPTVTGDSVGAEGEGGETRALTAPAEEAPPLPPPAVGVTDGPALSSLLRSEGRSREKVRSAALDYGQRLLTLALLEQAAHEKRHLWRLEHVPSTDRFTGRGADARRAFAADPTHADWQILELVVKEQRLRAARLEAAGRSFSRFFVAFEVLMPAEVAPTGAEAAEGDAAMISRGQTQSAATAADPPNNHHAASAGSPSRLLLLRNEKKYDRVAAQRPVVVADINAPQRDTSPTRSGSPRPHRSLSPVLTAGALVASIPVLPSSTPQGVSPCEDPTSSTSAGGPMGRLRTLREAAAGGRCADNSAGLAPTFSVSIGPAQSSSPQSLRPQPRALCVLPQAQFAPHRLLKPMHGVRVPRVVYGSGGPSSPDPSAAGSGPSLMYWPSSSAMLRTGPSRVSMGTIVIAEPPAPLIADADAALLMEASGSSSEEDAEGLALRRISSTRAATAAGPAPSATAAMNVYAAGDDDGTAILGMARALVEAMRGVRSKRMRHQREMDRQRQLRQARWRRAQHHVRLQILTAQEADLAAAATAPTPRPEGPDGHADQDVSLSMPPIVESDDDGPELGSMLGDLPSFGASSSLFGGSLRSTRLSIGYPSAARMSRQLSLGSTSSQAVSGRHSSLRRRRSSRKHRDGRNSCNSTAAGADPLQQVMLLFARLAVLPPSHPQLASLHLRQARRKARAHVQWAVDAAASVAALWRATVDPPSAAHFASCSPSPAAHCATLRGLLAAMRSGSLSLPDHGADGALTPAAAPPSLYKRMSRAMRCGGDTTTPDGKGPMWWWQVPDATDANAAVPDGAGRWAAATRRLALLESCDRGALSADCGRCVAALVAAFWLRCAEASFEAMLHRECLALLQHVEAALFAGPDLLML